MWNKSQWRWIPMAVFTRGDLVAVEVVHQLSKKLVSKHHQPIHQTHHHARYHQFIQYHHAHQSLLMPARHRAHSEMEIPHWKIYSASSTLVISVTLYSCPKASSHLSLMQANPMLSLLELPNWMVVFWSFMLLMVPCHRQRNTVTDS